MDSVKELLVTAIPSLQDDKLEAVLKHLTDIGVESLSDLNFVDLLRLARSPTSSLHSGKVS